jgi:hypothetical protein
MADNLAKDEIDCQNLRYSRSILRAVTALTAEENIMIEVVVVGKSYKMVRVWKWKEGRVLSIESVSDEGTL